MELEEVLAELREPEAVEALRPGWERSEASFPDGLPSFLAPAEFRVSREWGGLGPEVDPELERTAARIAEDPALLHLAWHSYRLAFEEEGAGRVAWPRLEGALAGSGGAFYLLLALATVPKIRAAHRPRGVPEGVTRDTCADIRLGADRYRCISGGRLGVEARLLFWFRLIASGDLHRLGRMQYVIRPFRGKLRTYRQQGTGRVLALSEGGVRFNREGYVDGAGGVTDTEGGWTSCLAEEADTVTGSPVSPLGMAVRREVALSLSDWQCVLSPGDLVLEMHIPEGDAMTPEACLSSMEQALSFFPKCYPDRPFLAFACYSWILNTQLEEMLPPTSNLVRYQRELYLFPIPSSGRDGLYFIFYRDEVDVATAPRDTTLRRAILDRLAAGRPLRNGGMFLLREDLRHFGTQHYRSQWLAHEQKNLTTRPQDHKDQ